MDRRSRTPRRKELLFGILALAIVAGGWSWWQSPSEWESSVGRSPASEMSGVSSSLEPIRAELDGVTDDLLTSVIVTTARLVLPALLNRLDLEADVKKRIEARLNSTSFQDRIVPFLMNSVSLYESSGSRVPKPFREVMLPKLARFGKTPGLEHELFKILDVIPPKEESGGSPLRAKKVLITTVLRLYDALYLQTNAHIGDGVPKLTPAQLKTVEVNVTGIMKSLLDAQKDRAEVVEAIRGILNDSHKKETITLSLARFVFEFLERHYEVYIEPIRREQALRQWAGKKLDAFFDKKDPELYRFLDWEANRKRYSAHFVVDGLQGNLLEALTGGNPTFLKKVAQEHRDREKFRPQGEKVIDLPKTKNTYLEWIAADPRRVEDPLYLPFFKALYRDSRNSLARNGISTTPTISVRNLPIALTGEDVVGKKRATGVPNFHYVDRKGVDRDDRLPRAYYFFGNDAILLQEITRRAGMKTMFERVGELGLNSIACFTPYDRGATMAFDPLLNLAIGEKVRDFGEVACVADLVERSRAEIDLQKARSRLLYLMRGYMKEVGVDMIDRLKRYLIASNIRDALKQYVSLSQSGLPAYLQYYFPWPDHFAHFEGPFSDAILSPTGEYNRLDHWLGLIQRAYQEANLLPRTRFGMAGDHGLAPIYYALNPEVEVFEKFERETGTTLKVLKISSDEGEGPKMNHPGKPPAVKGYDLVIASTAGGNFMIDAFIDQGANWTRQPVYEELKRFKTLGGKTIDLISVITDRLPSSLDYLAVRDSECGPEACQTSLIARRGKDLIRERVFRKGDRIFYQPSGDLLQIRSLSAYRAVDQAEKDVHTEYLKKCVEKADARDSSTWCNSEEWRLLAESTQRPDSVVQIARLYDSDKAGTINLFPRDGIGYNTKVPGRHAGEHFHEKDAFVGVWGGDTARKTRINSAVNGAISPMLLEWMSPPSVRVPDEFGFPSFAGD